VSEVRGIRLTSSGRSKERRLLTLLSARAAGDTRDLDGTVEDAQLLGSLELAGFEVAWDDVRSERRGAPAPEPVRALRRARAAVDVRSPFSVHAVRAWHAALTGSASGWRRTARTREGATPAPAAFIARRLAVLEQWLEADSGRALKPAEQGALALARIVEILPFEDGNGRVARLAASHLMVRGGLRPPILVRGDAPRLRAALGAAFRFETEPLVRLLEEASERAIDVMIQALEDG
jgi:Fic family protein